VIARFIEGRSLRDIGAQHGISEDAAQKRVSRGVEKMRLFLQRRGVKTGVVGLAAMLTAELSRGAESGLVDSAIAGVHSALKGTAVSSAGLQLANAAARKLLLARMAQIAASSFLTVALVVTGGVIWRDRAIPAGAAFLPRRGRGPLVFAAADR
jgi:hypothetical protein